MAAATQPFIDINDHAELAKFGLHNGPPQDRNNLGEKWEAMGLVPALDPTHPRDVFLLVANDNDFLQDYNGQTNSNPNQFFVFGYTDDDLHGLTYVPQFPAQK